MGLNMEDVRTAIANSNGIGPVGMFDGGERAISIATNDQLRAAPDYDPIVVRNANGTVVRLSAVASIESGVRNSRTAAWFNGQPSVLLVINKQSTANVIETVDRIYQLLPEIKRWISPGIDITVMSDRTSTIRASVFDMQLTLIATVILVMLVVFVFLRRAATTVAAGVTVPLTLAFAIAVSTAVSLTLTPMICAHFVRKPPSPDATWLDRAVERVMRLMVRGYAKSLAAVLHHQGLMLLIVTATLAITIMLYVRTPKGYFPQDDTGLIWCSTQASTEISFQAMYDLQQKAEALVRADPAVANVGSSIGSMGYTAPVNPGSLFNAAQPPAARDGLSAPAVANRLRQKTAEVPGLRLHFFPMQDVRVGGRQSDSAYQYTLWDANYQELLTWAPRALEKIQGLPELVDVSTDREQGGLQGNVSIDRPAASRLGVRVQDIANALNNAYSQRQISTLYTQRNQYRVVLEIDPQYQRDPNDLARIYVSGANNTQVPLTAVTKIERGLSPLVVSHQGQFPAITISFGLRENVTIEQATRLIDQAVAELHIPDALHAEYAGDARAYRASIGAQPLLIVAALIAVYIVLGVLYESLAHPLTIISTLPSAGLGALLALALTGSELTVIAFIGIILLIGIVKKNGIMLVDFALDAERRRGLAPEQAIFEACLERFRPILMTTMASLLGAVPLAVAIGPGSELRRPLGITIIGGLLGPQALALSPPPGSHRLPDPPHPPPGGP